MSDLPDFSLEQCIARRLMVDIRLFADSGKPEPVRELPGQLARALEALQPCGVILFRENLASVAQGRQLTAALREHLSPQLLIGVDQEGGLVTRLPREEATSFSGNMALAACPAGEREQLARLMAQAQAAELRSLGINVNFVPCLDVNSNPANPVIHVRSFGDDPALVAAMGAAIVQGVQREGVAACLKHFPGHGDTAVDSHSGLPRVERDREAALAIDLAPFAQVIAGTSPALVMSAHIQYPALDDSCLPGTDTLRPATLSRQIITGLLREQMGFAGVVISDALDMAAISSLLSPEEAVVECFRAGVDIALMPLLLRSPASLESLQRLVTSVAARVRAGELDEAELRAGAARVVALQKALRLKPEQLNGGGTDVIGSPEHRQLERQIAAGSITRLRGENAPVRPGCRVHLLMPCADSAAAMTRALQALEPTISVTSQSLAAFDPAREAELVKLADVYLVGVSDPPRSAVAIGGAEDLSGDDREALGEGDPLNYQRELLQRAAGRARAVVMLGSPGRAGKFLDSAETVLASYDGAALGEGGGPGPAYAALAAVLSGHAAAPGVLPVALPLC